jgi:hypothetical protein
MPAAAQRDDGQHSDDPAPEQGHRQPQHKIQGPLNVHRLLVHFGVHGDLVPHPFP